MLTERQTDEAIEELAARVAEFGWPDHTAENSRRWLQCGAVVAHVGREVIAIRTWTGAILTQRRDPNSADGARRAREEFYGLEGEPVVNEEARLIAQAGDGDDHTYEKKRVEYFYCYEHGSNPVIGCNACGFPVIERIGSCGCPRPRAFVDGHHNHRFITGQIDHHKNCPGYEPKTIVRQSAPAIVAPTEIVKPKDMTKKKIISLSLFDSAANELPKTIMPTEITHNDIRNDTAVATTAHHCHAHGCTKPIEPSKFACPPHWYSLRKEMHFAIWREYRAGQEFRKDPTIRYLAVQHRAVAEIAMYRPKSAKGLAGWNEAASKAIASPYLEKSERFRLIAIESGFGDPLEGLVSR